MAIDEAGDGSAPVPHIYIDFDDPRLLGYHEFKFTVDRPAEVEPLAATRTNIFPKESAEVPPMQIPGDPSVPESDKP